MDFSQEQYDQISKREDWLPIIEGLKELKLKSKEIIARVESLGIIVNDAHSELPNREIKK